MVDQASHAKLEEDIKENLWGGLFPHKLRETTCSFCLIQTLDYHQLSQGWFCYLDSVDIRKLSLMVITMNILLLDSYLSIIIVLARKEQVIRGLNLQVIAGAQ